jgi:Transposase and inactivated derivatives
MKITLEQYEKIAKYLPRQRGNVSMSNLQLVNAILYVTENGCKWRALPRSYGNWHTVYVRMNRWSKNGVLQHLFEGLQRENIIHIKLEAVCLDSTSIKVHPHATGALKKMGNKKSVAPAEDSQQKFIWSPHLTVRLFHSHFQAGMQVMDQKDENC